MLFCFLTFPLSDTSNLVLGLVPDGNMLNDLLYCIIGIGAIEELVKIIPLLIILKFTKIINEPLDYIIYASLSALGFAFVENLIYFSEHNLHIIHGRAMTAVVSHMFDSSIIAYGLILNKYKRRKNQILNFFLFFSLAAISHGFYDFWLINESARSFSFLTTIYLLISIFMWNSFKNNALNQSIYYDKDLLINSEKLQDYLSYSLAGVLLFEYFAIAFKYGPTVANGSLLSSLYSGTYLIAFLSSSLGKFNLNKGEWTPIKYWAATEDLVNYDKIINVDFKINAFTQNEFTKELLPNEGVIIKRLSISKEPDWYLFRLKHIKYFDSYLGDAIIIRTKDKDELIEKDNKHLLLYVSFLIISI